MTIMQKFVWIVATLGNLLALLFLNYSGSIVAIVLLVLTVTYSIIGCYDMFYSKHTLNRLYPVVAYLRYFLESYRVEIQRYRGTPFQSRATLTGLSTIKKRARHNSVWHPKRFSRAKLP